MFGPILVIIGTFLDEISASLGKWEVAHRRESLYTYGFLNYFWIIVFAIVLTLITGNLQFNLASIPLFILLIILEIAQVYALLHATVEADRSTVSFLMIGTIPLILLVDSFLGYDITFNRLIGISIIILGLIILLLNHGFSKKSLGYIVFATINAVATTSIYKYMISVYNSVEMQTIISAFFIAIFLLIMALSKSKQNPFTYIFKKEFLIQSISQGLGGILINISFLYGPASVIISAKRGTTVLASIISGNQVFHEKRLSVKILSFLFVVTGLVFLIL